MKRIVCVVAIAICVIAAFAGCNKRNTTYTVYSYANFTGSDGPLNLYIDDQLKGELPYFTKRPTCEDDSLKQRALTFTLSNGKYKVAAKTQGGAIKSSGTITLKETRNSFKSGVTGGVGGQELAVVGDCIILGMTE